MAGQSRPKGAKVRGKADFRKDCKRSHMGGMKKAERCSGCAPLGGTVLSAAQLC